MVIAQSGDGWLVAAAVLLTCVRTQCLARTIAQDGARPPSSAALVTEVFDQHLARFAGELRRRRWLSTDRSPRSPEPWFQGKLPFSFNLPESLPIRTLLLDGANLTYLHNLPVAQLLYSIGKHRVSVFVREKPDATGADEAQAEHAGFHVMDFSTDDLEGVAVSDVDPARLAELVSAIRQAQTTR